MVRDTFVPIVLSPPLSLFSFQNSTRKSNSTSLKCFLTFQALVPPKVSFNENTVTVPLRTSIHTSFPQSYSQSSPEACGRDHYPANICEAHPLKWLPEPSPCVLCFSETHPQVWTGPTFVSRHHCWMCESTLTGPPKNRASMLLTSGMELPAPSSRAAKKEQGGLDFSSRTSPE